MNRDKSKDKTKVTNYRIPYLQIIAEIISRLALQLLEVSESQLVHKRKG